MDLDNFDELILLAPDATPEGYVAYAPLSGRSMGLWDRIVAALRLVRGARFGGAFIRRDEVPRLSAHYAAHFTAQKGDAQDAELRATPAAVIDGELAQPQ